MFKKFAVTVAVVVSALTSFGMGTAHASAVLGGGSGLLVDDKLWCSLTTIGYDGGGNLVGLTAGHCGGPGALVKAERDPGAGIVGHVVSANPDLDYAVIRFDGAKTIPVNSINGTTITNVGAPAGFGSIACKEGRTTGNTCGIIWGDVFNTGIESWSQICVIEGDSGAPVVVGTTLVGMINAYLVVGCVGPTVGSNIDAILGDMNARGGVGAGFRPI